MPTILIIGAGPIIIGRALREFDYSGTQACKTLRAEGYRIVLVNSNPATIMTDPDMADRTYLEPITPEIVAKIISKERHVSPRRFRAVADHGRPDRAQLRALFKKNAVLEKFEVEMMIGASAATIGMAEDAQAFPRGDDPHRPCDATPLAI